MRDVYFRAKRLDHSEWVYGHYYQNYEIGEVGIVNQHFMVIRTKHHQTEHIQIDPKTLCQYSGVRDKKNNEIYDRDIMKSAQGGNHLVVFRNGCFTIEHNDNCCKPWKGGCLYSVHYTDVVIGNLIDTPELLGES